MNNFEAREMINRQIAQIEQLDIQLSKELITPTFHRIGVKMSKRTIECLRRNLHQQSVVNS